jgi:hypothetical protein
MSKLHLTNTIIELIRKKAPTIAEQKNNFLKLQFGRKNGYVWIASDADCLLEPETVDVDGRNFFVSLFRI